jgi:GNAT superfamily N-acetyltransferase
MNRELQVHVLELTPERVDEYLRFFDKDAFTDFPDWSGCYCGFYDTPGDHWDSTGKSGPEHRVARAERIRSGQAHGLLAMADGKMVGWCNAQARSSFQNMRRYAVTIEDPKEPVGSIMCFLVAPGYRGKGVGTALLNAACDMFQREGLRWAEGYPTTNTAKRTWQIPWAEENYKGSLNMYLKAGFKVQRQLERFAVVRKQL